MTQQQQIEVEKILIDNPDLVETLSKYTKEELLKVFQKYKMLDLLGKQCIPCDDDWDSLELILDTCSDRNPRWAIMNAFLFGRIQGQRLERAKRNKGHVNKRNIA